MFLCCQFSLLIYSCHSFTHLPPNVPNRCILDIPQKGVQSFGTIAWAYEVVVVVVVVDVVVVMVETVVGDGDFVGVTVADVVVD